MFDDVCSCLVAAYRWSIVGQVLDHRAAWILQLFVGRVRCEVCGHLGADARPKLGKERAPPNLFGIAAIASLRLARPTPVATALMHLKD